MVRAFTQQKGVASLLLIHLLISQRMKQLAFNFSRFRSDGYIIPLGHETDTGVLCSELPHNEFIVYDPAQA